MNPSQLADAIRMAAQSSNNEEELKISVEALLAPLREQLGISPSYERSYSDSATKLTGSGYSDAVYGHAIIEYKRPGRLASNAGVVEAFGELRRYMVSEALRETTDVGEALKRIIGIFIDGEHIGFVRFVGDPAVSDASAISQEDFNLSRTFDVNPESVEQMIGYLRGLRFRALTAEDLAERFGPGSNVANSVINWLYASLSDTTSPKTTTLYQ